MNISQLRNFMEKANLHAAELKKRADDLRKTAENEKQQTQEKRDGGKIS